ncbi:outer membrane protein assembly factor BamB family protein [Dysgonomonas sp.]
MKKTLMTILLLLISTGLFASHRGRVFVDYNKNGIYDNGEMLLGGVLVTDGLNVVKTNSKGEFQLAGHPKERFITVTTPSGYKTVNAHYLRINSDINSYDFALEVWETRIAADGSHKFIQIADTEISTSIDQERWTQNVRDYINNENVAFVMHTGDICYEKGLQEHIRLMNSRNMGCPVYYAIGNHDLVKGDYGEQLFESIYGPVWFSFDYGNVHYIVTPMPSGDYEPSYRETDVYEWLKNDLALVDKNTPIICFNHDLKSYTDEFIFKKNDNEKLVLSNYNLKAWIYGHWHNHFVRQQGKVKTISTATPDKGGIDHSTSAFRVMSVDSKGDVDTQLKYTYIKNNVVIASIGNEYVPINAQGTIPLTVNAYSTVTHVRSIDYLLSDENKVIKTGQGLKQNSDWSWHTDIDIPSQYINRQLFVEVTVRFNNGEIAKARESFFYNKDQKKGLKIKENWTTLLGNSEHNTYNANPLKMPPKLSWISNVKANVFMSSPLVYDGQVYIATVDEDLKGVGGIYALNAKDGSLKWFFKIRNSIKNTIAIESENVLAQDAEGYLYAVNAKTGKLSWKTKLEINGLPVLDEGLTVRNGIVYAGAGKGFAAYDARTGERKWINLDWGQGEGTTSTVSANDDVVISGAQWRGMYANDAKTGKLLWSQKKDGISNRGSSPVLTNGLAYFISSQSLFILDAKSGQIVLSKKLPYSVDVTSTPLLTDKLIIFGTVNDGLVALDRENYTEKWRIGTQAALVYTVPYTRYPVMTIESSPVGIGNHVLFGASDGYIYVVNMESGKINWKYEVGAPIFSTVAVSDNSFFIADFGGNIYAFSCEE